jgi:hypothetical protein
VGGCGVDSSVSGRRKITGSSMESNKFEVLWSNDIDSFQLTSWRNAPWRTRNSTPAPWRTQGKHFLISRTVSIRLFPLPARSGRLFQLRSRTQCTNGSHSAHANWFLAQVQGRGYVRFIFWPEAAVRAVFDFQSGSFAKTDIRVLFENIKAQDESLSCWGLHNRNSIWHLDVSLP